MTAEDRYIVDIADLRAVRLECATCGASVTIPVEKWDGQIHQCPSCGTPWHSSPQPFEMLQKLRTGMQGVTAMMRAHPTYRVSFEVDRPKD